MNGEEAVETVMAGSDTRQGPRRKRVRRRNYFINHRLQGRYMFMLYLLVTMVVVLFSVLLLYFSNQGMTITYENQNVQVGATPLMLMKDIVVAVWLVVVLVGLVVALFGMFHSHRIAGPLYKFSMIFDQMGRGILPTTLRLRRKDEGQEVMGKLQEATRFLAGRVRELRAQTTRIEAAAARSGDPELARAVKTLRELLDGFEIKG